MAGLACARLLRQAGCYVDVFEQDRIVGGRMATLRLGMDTFDHGAQYLTARGSGFRSYIDELTGIGYASRWMPRATTDGEGGGGQLMPWYVGTPGMSSIVRPLAEGVRIQSGRRAHTISRDSKGWHIWFDDETSLGPFSAVAVAVPAPSARLLLGRIEEISETLSRVRMSPCWALMVKLDRKTLPEQDVFSDMSEVIRWIARNNVKPGRSQQGETIVVHASPAWSREAEDVDAEEVAEAMWGEVCQVLELPPVRPVRMTAHLWRNGLVDTSLGESFVFSTEHRVGAAGDWCLGRLAEHAYESGTGLGRAIASAIM